MWITTKKMAIIIKAMAQPPVLHPINLPIHLMLVWISTKAMAQPPVLHPINLPIHLMLVWIFNNVDDDDIKAMDLND